MPGIGIPSEPSMIGMLHENAKDRMRELSLATDLSFAIVHSGLRQVPSTDFVEFLLAESTIVLNVMF